MNGTETTEHIMPTVEQVGYLDQMLAIDPMLEDLDASMSLIGDPIHALPADSANVAESHLSQRPHPSSVFHDTAHTPHSTVLNLATPPLQTPPSLPCACVANHYLVTSRLHSASDGSTTTTAISRRLTVCRSALYIAESFLRCPHCPTTQMTGSHNVMMLVSLLSGIALAYKKLCDEVREAAEQMIQQEKEIDFQLLESHQRRPKSEADRQASTTNSHDPISDGTEHAQANAQHEGLAMSLTGRAWRDLVLAAINREIFSADPTPPIVSPPPTLGPDLGSDPTPDDTTTTAVPRPTLEGIITTMEGRQRRRHATLTPVVGEQAQKLYDKDDDFACLKMIGHVRSIVDGLKDT